MEDKVLIYNKREWYNYIDLGLGFSMNDIDNAEKKDNGYIGKWQGIKCYVSRYIKEVGDEKG